MNYWLLSAEFVFTAILLLYLINGRLAHLALDKPNERSLHTTLTPRTGGLALMAGVLAGWAYLGVQAYWLALPLLLIFVSLIDDIRGLPARWRFLAQAVVCTAFLAIGANGLGWWFIAPLLVAMLWMVNLYNFMDGSDGLAGGMAFFGFSAYGFAAYWGQDLQLAMMNACIVAGSLAFLVFNFNPARIFMGDAGSVPLGFLAAAIGLHGWQQELWPLWFPLLVFSPFIVDATVTLVRRLLRGEVIWQAHRSHYYQRLIQMGWGHKKTAIAEYCLMLLVGMAACYGLDQSLAVVSIIFAFWLAVYVVLMAMIDARWAERLP
ncbi:Fuc2NAc and GlcNAc transferase [Methylophilaceae bacterium]|nr:Fuc2NAc and GlcNAc transferase [Methylophilaceae bacterium]